MDAVFTMAPPPRLSSSGMARLVARNTLVSPMLITCAHTCSSSSPVKARRLCPGGSGGWPKALLSRISRPPKASTVPPTMASMPAGVPTSAAMAMALPPAPTISVVTASAFARSRSATATCAPRAANPTAAARPMPEPAPDTSATLAVETHVPSSRAALGTRDGEVSRNDHLLFHHEGLDAADEERAVGEERLGLRRGVSAGHGGAVVVPELRDAV